MIFKRSKMKQIGALVDGEARSAGDAAPYLDDAVLKRHHDALVALRAGVATSARAPEINDAQFGAFMNGVREGIEAPAPGHAGLWATASLAAAVLVLIFSALAFLSTGSDPVRATEVESVTTELEGVTIRSYDNQQGVSTVWVTMPESDLW